MTLSLPVLATVVSGETIHCVSDGVVDNIVNSTTNGHGYDVRSTNGDGCAGGEADAGEDDGGDTCVAFNADAARILCDAQRHN